ncbi:unnamed protein product [Chilo suppressalis]|uniref:B-block binding subunit of TFIIIC domain-containing protein n=1 Tax=Chilo suppressalis TaxID=168631 RepID=A0ABN8B252_CHISP|nr:unnamed protein product [Chilo suppressalis]
MKDQFARHGIPKELITDNGPAYASKEFKEFSKQWCFHHITTAPNYPQSNGRSEKAVHIIKNMLIKSVSSGTDFYLGLLNFRSTPRDVIRSPSQLLMGRRLNTRLPSHENKLLPSHKNTVDYESILHKQVMTKKYYDKRSRSLPELVPGQRAVMVDDRDHILVDEIALEGLEGIGINLLWKRIEKRISTSVTEKMQRRLWNIILKFDSIYLYENPEPVPHLDIIDRFTIVDDANGDLREPDDYLDGPYEYQPVDCDNGSSVHYKRRVLLDKDILSKMDYKEVLSTYNNTLVLVASKEERWGALVPHLPMSHAEKLTKLHYCILELIGKSRANGQMTVGKTNLAKLVKDPKLLFYNRKVLQELDLVRVSHINQWVPTRRGTKVILLRLRRFHQSVICSIPKTGWIYNLVQYLKDQPNYCESTAVVLKKGLITRKHNKRFQKISYIFGFDDQPIKINEIAMPNKRAKTQNRRRYIYLYSITDDEHTESEDEEQKSPMKCQYKVGINLLRQAYERFLEAGLKGLTQIELGELLGIEFYISRTICRIFRAKNIVREFLEDKGRQRTARFIAVAATAKIDNQYAEEKEKFLKYVAEFTKINNEETASNLESETEVPRKRIKIEDNPEYEKYVFEIKNIQGIPTLPNPLSESTKKLTLKQLKFATAVLKVIRDNQVIVNFFGLSKLLALETKQRPMDTKPLKIFLQRLVLDGCVKIFGIKWPGYQDKYTVLICAPHIKPSHPMIVNKYKEIASNSKRILAQNKSRYKPLKPLTEYSYPRYVKLQKLHEAMVKYAYLDDLKSEPSELSEGFVYIKDLIPELTLELALGTINSAGILKLSKFNIDEDLLKTKLCEVPVELNKALTNSSYLEKSIRTNLKALAMFGLVQLIALAAPKDVTIPDNCLDIHLFYVNKNAAILDTSGIWPKRNMCNQNYEKKFRFDTFEDVKDYWSTVYNISTSTTIETPNRRQRKLPSIPIRAQSEVDEYDKGLRLGNNLGPCGFHSSFFLDMPRLWKTYSARTSHFPPRKQIKKVIRIPRFEKTQKKLTKIQKRTIRKPNFIEKLPSIKTKLLKQAILKQSLVRRRKDLDNTVWSREDDRIVMLCKTAITIMSPISQPGCLLVRNLVTKDILSLKDPKKSQKICHKRAAIVDTNATLIHLRDSIMAELKYHSAILHKYEGILKKIRLMNSNSNPTQYIQAARVPMMELVWVLMDVLKICSTKQNVPVFTSLEELYKKFTVVPSSENRPSNSYKTAPDDVLLGPLKEAIMLTVMLSFDNELTKENALKIYHNFKRFDEKVLRKAVSQLRQCGAITAKGKILSGILHKINLDDLVDCWYKISAQYQRKWMVRLNSEFVDDLGNCFDKSIIQDDLKGSPDINCFSCELYAMGVVDMIILIAPVISGFTGSIIQEDQLNVIDIESRYKLKSGTIIWKIENNIGHFNDIYKGIDIEAPLQDILRESVIKRGQKLKSNFDKQLTETENTIVAYLKMKHEHGSNFSELKEICDLGTESLMKGLRNLIAKNIVKRVGVYDNIFIMMNYIKNWSMEVDNFHILSKPWIGIDAKMREDIFLKWVGVVINKVFECPGSNLCYLSDNCDFLSTAAVQDICTVLSQWGCVSLHCIYEEEPNLFSEDNDPVEIVDYNEYESPQNIVVKPMVDSLVRYSFIRKTILNSV